ncbi:hypothetical protein BGZ93_007604 [Podila epicladia]|nr:hypothetical protein BGZ93_007604 [Podila epicladia]
MTMDPINGGVGIKRFMSLQPRDANMPMEYNDSGEDSDAYLSPDYKIKRRNTKELVDFFNNAPPPRPAPSLPPIFEDDKKKPTLLQRLRPKKPGQTHGHSTFYPTIQHSLTPGSNSTLSLNPTEVASEPNGKKYVMIAVDYKDKDRVPPSAIGVRANGSKSLELTRTAGGSRGDGTEPLSTRDSIFIPRQVLSKLDEARDGSEKRLTNQSGEDVLFFLDSSPFLLDNFTLDKFSLDADFVVQPTSPENNTQSNQNQRRQTLDYTQYVPSTQYVPNTNKKKDSSESSPAEKSPPAPPPPQQQQQQQQQGDPDRRAGPKRNRVTFNIATDTNASPEEDTLSKMLSLRIASHKEKLARNEAMMSDTSILEPVYPSSSESSPTTTSSSSGHNSLSSGHGSDIIVLPKAANRKKVRHVQIQTQHLLMRPTFTQTSPADVAGQNVQVQEWGTQTADVRSEGTSTDDATSPTTTTGAKEAKSVITPVVPLAKWRTASELSQQEREELNMLRQKHTQLQAQVASLQRDLSSEIRSRTRSAVAMQDTREKFEMLSAMAYKKLKEMIYQRHVLEMEVRELRAQVDIQTAEDELMHHPSVPSRRPSCDNKQPQPQPQPQQQQQQRQQQQQQQQRGF